MGGRGALAPAIPDHLRLPITPPTEFHVAPPVEGSYNYDVVSPEALPGGMHYAFLEGLGRGWHIITQGLEAHEPLHPHHTFGMDAPTLRWVKDDKVVDLYVDGMTTDDFSNASGLQFHNEVKGPYVLSKRISRVMRPYFLSGSFDPAEVDIRYLDQADYAALLPDPQTGEKVFDGAGVISRRMLEKLTIREGMSAAKQIKLRREIAQAGRVEFTIMTERGQDKGHAIVNDDLDADFLIPQDTKREITLGNGQTWIGIDFVHGKDHMRIDVQSLINLHPFFNEAQYAQWLHDEGEVFIQAVQSGDVASALRAKVAVARQLPVLGRSSSNRIDAGETVEEVRRWALREFFASGGHPMHFQYHTKALLNRHIERLNPGPKPRLPIPGGRYYVMPAAVGRAAGLDLALEPGQVHIDKHRGTAWVHEQDWLGLPDSPKQEGIAGILGGADNDDALWLHPFTDYDGSQRVLAWRSPNQLGEYILLQPTADSHIPAWRTAEGDAVTFTPADSRKLPKRVDHLNPDYLGLVDQETGEALGQGEPYSLAAMNQAIARAIDNQGALGMYCNSLMVNKALMDSEPRESEHGSVSPSNWLVQLPAPLEDVIDASVKTGADLSRVKQWNYDNSRAILDARTPIPELLHSRLSIDRETRPRAPRPKSTYNHWLDRIDRMLKGHISKMEQARADLVKQCMPPQAVFDAALEEPEAIEWGAGLNAAYAKSIRTRADTQSPPTPEDHESARRAAEQYLARFPDHQHGALLRGAMVSAYMGEEPTSDNAVWLMGEQTPDGRMPGLAQKSLAALREVGALDELANAPGGAVTYPGAAVRQPALPTVGIKGVWFNWYRAQEAAAGQPVPEKYGDVPRPLQRQLKAKVAQLAHTDFRGLRLRIGEDEQGKPIALTEAGHMFGYLKPGADALSVGDEIELRLSMARDGSLRVQFEAR